MSVTVTSTLQIQFTSYSSAVLADTPVGYWRLGESAGPTATDLSGNARHGSYIGTYTLGALGAVPPDTALSVDGRSNVDAYVTMGDISAFGFAGVSFTVECWVKWTVAQGSKPIISKRTADSGIYRGWSLLVSNGGSGGQIIFTVSDGAGDGGSVTSSISALNDGEWHHVVGTFTALRIELWIDGVARGNAVPTAVIDANPSDQFRISHPSSSVGPYSTNDAFVGSIDEVALYSGTALSSTRIAAHYEAQTEWSDISADVRGQSPISLRYGVDGHDPNDRIANTGQLEFSLDNSTLNSGALLGYYSPFHANRRAGFTHNVGIRWKLVSGATTAYKFRGALVDIDPQPGRYDDRLVPCTALDWMDTAANVDLPDIAAQTSKRPDEIVTSILDLLDDRDQPVSRTIETSLSTLAYSLDGGATGARPKFRAVLNQIAMSEFGYVYIKGNTTAGGEFVFENRHHRSANPTIQATLTDADYIAIAVPTSRDEVYSSVQVYCSPTSIDAAATTVLFALQTTQTLIQPGETNSSLFGPYRDPVSRQPIGGTATVDPVITTDYLMNSASDGTGSNLSANFTVVATRTGVGVRFDITNNGATAGYVTKLQVRGKGIYRYTAMVESLIGGSYGTRPLIVTMPYQNDTNIAKDVADYLAAIYATPFAYARSVTFLANRSSTLMGYALLREPGDRVSISETVSGVDGDFTINGCRYVHEHGGALWCTWELAPALADGQYWLWGTAGASEWGETTRYGF